MFKVYWTQEGVALGTDFDSNKMSEAMKFMEMLRKDPEVSFVTFCSENPNSVGKPGVAETGADYNWTKRRKNDRPTAYNSNDEVRVELHD